MSVIGSHPSVTVEQFLKTRELQHNVIKFVVAWRSIFTQNGWSALSDNAMGVDVNVAAPDKASTSGEASVISISRPRDAADRDLEILSDMDS